MSAAPPPSANGSSQQQAAPGPIPQVHSTPLPRYSGPAVAREKLHYVSTLRFPRIATPLSVDKALRLLVHILQSVNAAGSQHSFYWAQITSPQAGDCYAIQRQSAAAARPSDGCEWIMDAQVLTGTFSEWPIEVFIYTRGAAERQRNPATALARLEYRVLLPSQGGYASANSNLAFLQFLPLISLKNFQPLAPSQPPLIPPPFLTALATFANRPAPMRPPPKPVPISTTNVSRAAASTARLTPASTTIMMPTTSKASKKGSIVTGPVTSAASTGVSGSVMTMHPTSALYPEEPIELMSMAPIDLVDEVEQSLLRIHSRHAIINHTFLYPPGYCSDDIEAPSVDLLPPGIPTKSSNLEEEINKCKEEINKCKEEIARSQELTQVEQDRIKRLRTLQNEVLDQVTKDKQMINMNDAITYIQRLTSFRLRSQSHVE